MSEHTITINEDGWLSFIWADELAKLRDLGRTTISRASHVEPTPDGQWTADMSPITPGVVLGPFDLRGEALAAERAYLLER